MFRLRGLNGTAEELSRGIRLFSSCATTSLTHLSAPVVILHLLAIMASVGVKAAEFIDNVENCTPQERIKLLQSLNEMLVDSLRQGEEKVALATAAYDVVIILLEFCGHWSGTFVAV